MKILVVNGPNLNLLGKREPSIYGGDALEQINNDLASKAQDLGVEIEFFQSNHEGEIVERIQKATKFDGILINAAAYTHTSIVIRDALIAVGIPFVEVHLSNIYKRENFRHHSFLSDVAVGVVCGFGGDSYRLALEGLVRHLKRSG